MKIRKYNLELDKNKHPFLVKECETNYNVDILNTPLLIADMANSLYRLDKQVGTFFPTLSVQLGSLSDSAHDAVSH